MICIDKLPKYTSVRTMVPNEEDMLADSEDWTLY